ncbi:MAG: hypothetical protein JWR37_2170 [Mycobacterium sp.]|nr:hypothetical protein [Mycobacterium sp.]
MSLTRGAIAVTTPVFTSRSVTANADHVPAPVLVDPIGDRNVSRGAN